VDRDEMLVELAHENFVASFAKLAEHCDGGLHRRFDGVFGFVTGLPFSLFNGCVVVEPVAPADLDAALGWVATQGLPMRLFVAHGLEPELEEVAAAYKLERESWPYPAMALHSLPEPSFAASGVVVASVDEEGPDEFRGVGVAGGLDRELAERMFPDALFEDREVEGFVGRLHGRAVGYSLAVRSEGASGVYNVATLRDARGRGVGTALTWAAVEAGREWGCEVSVLQSTEMALAMYEAMGFRRVVDYAVFKAPATPMGQETPVPPSPQ
jgi:GNAT superfamily N-acetyltransferase